ncbi:hypothetical protein L1049_001915 [Liquidambar formosana]|uniref:Uncharacterized protein n=1 Tax=Liquidambar formosana TaxID=63359 RepID=A0AAP0NEM2_LIQFO
MIQKFIGGRWTRFCGREVERGNSLLNIIFNLWWGRLELDSLPVTLGWLMFPPKCVFLRGLLVGGNASPLIIFRGEVFICLTDVCCVKKIGKPVDHLLIHREVSYQLWVFCLNFFGMHWIMLKRVIEVVAS